MKSKRQCDPLDMIALMLNIIALVPNLMILLPLLFEQAKTGWGFPTHFEMAVLFFGLCQFLTVPIIIVMAGYTVFCLIKRKSSRLFFTNTALIGLTLVSLVLSIIFEYH
jgi:hypothetical protein